MGKFWLEQSTAETWEDRGGRTHRRRGGSDAQPLRQTSKTDLTQIWFKSNPRSTKTSMPHA
ncbi:hypothetical protein HID58_006249 [Brassica napus]|uniref:Uncharacterized protein n=1 Tax=Brassica napus TaxID=3708 RepID=A0ABQ8EAV7_BRANA|nr:hypothetical protein HID58_006249 [Brassica napus]